MSGICRTCFFHVCKLQPGLLSGYFLNTELFTVKCFLKFNQQQTVRNEYILHFSIPYKGMDDVRVWLFDEFVNDFSNYFFH